MTKETVGLFIATGVAIFRPLLIKAYEKYVSESPAVDRAIAYITRGRWKRKTKNKEKKNSEIDAILNNLGWGYKFNRVSLVEYNYVGPGTFPENPTLEDFENLELTITNEWSDASTRSVMAEFQNYPASIFVKALYKLHYSPARYIVIPEDENDVENNEVQNLFGVVKSYRFLLATKITDGSLALSFTHEFFAYDRSPKQMAEMVTAVRLAARRILIIKKKYI